MTDQNFAVSWFIEDTDSATPQQAAEQALNLIRQAKLGDPEAANVFTVFDKIVDQSHQIDLGDLMSEDNKTTTIWPRPKGQRYESRLGRADARYLTDDHGFITLRVRIDQNYYLEGHAIALSDSMGDDHFDHLHDTALSFGVATDSSAKIVAVDGSDFLVDYTTNISTFI